MRERPVVGRLLTYNFTVGASHTGSPISDVPPRKTRQICQEFMGMAFPALNDL
jgi:hypothetical protein